jgi:hypothetical protein
MSAAIWFWIIYVIALLFCGWVMWPVGMASGPVVVVFVLIGLLGWGVFGAPIK